MHRDIPDNLQIFDLTLQKMASEKENREGAHFNLSPEKYSDILVFVEKIWDEYLNENMFDRGMTEHIITDEYYEGKNHFRRFSDNLIEYVQSQGYTARLLGAFPPDGQSGSTQ